MLEDVSRRGALAGIAALTTALVSDRVVAQPAPTEVDLVDDAQLGEMGKFDANFYGPPSTRAAKTAFVFPTDAESASAYGIDISHHTQSVPWSELRAAKINYVYIKAGQGRRNRDAQLESHWAAATSAGIPCGAYHFLSAGIPGKEQGAYFLKRIEDVGGLKRAVHLQPVVDLEWDFLGANFHRTQLRTVGGAPVYKDYWSDYTSDQIVGEVEDCLDVLRNGLAPLGVKPIIYTNRSWWETRLKQGVKFTGCTIWTSDYRNASYANGIPRSVPGHDYHLWQFTERGTIKAGNKTYGPFDCNKLVRGSLNDLLIA